MFFAIADYLAGALIGVVTALAVRLIIWPGMDMVIAMLIGMGLGMVLHFVIAFMLAPFIGMFETMLPGSLTGMYGGMMFAMRDSMGAGSPELSSALLVGAVFGVVVTAGMKFYNRALSGAVLDIEL